MSAKTSRPTKIAKYEIKRRIGRGAMGVVYEAFDPFVQRTVAIKVAHSASDMDDATKQKHREGFFAEVYSAGRMHHPSVVSVYDAGQEEDLNYIVMEFVDGQTLQEYVTGDRSLTPNQIVDVIYQCAKGLDYVHREGIIHRDLKPGNIMLSNDGEVKIMDFSIAHVDVGFEGHDTEVQGSPMYMPPEQLTEEKRLVAQSDIYSLGAVMYSLLAKKTPYKAGTLESLIYKITNLEPEPITELNPEVPKHIADIVEKAMHKIIYNRYDSAYLLARDLSNAFGRLRGVGERIDMQEKWKTLRFLAFFKDFSDEQITEVVNASEWKEFTKGEVIVTEGEQETAFYIIAKGGVDVVKNDKVVGTMKQGDCFGEIAFLTNQPRYYRIFLENLVARLSQATDKLVEADKEITAP
jgi:serine/threonine protein kinase